MASSINNFFIDTIKSLTPDDFCKLVCIYEKYVLGADEIVEIDGANDGGNDIKIFKGHTFLLRCVQLTTQKFLDKKLRSDLAKAQKNIAEHHYSDVLEYFWSQTASEDKINEYKKIAREEYAIDLQFYDAKMLAGANHKLVKDFLYSIHKTNPNSKVTDIEKSTKVLFDLLSLGQNTSDIKNNLINSIIIFFVYDQETVTINAIYRYIQSSVNKSLSDEFILQQINQLKSDKRLIANPDNKHSVYLSETEKEQISDIVKQTDIKQADFEKQFTNILTKYGQGDKFSQYLDYLKKLYESYYQFNIDESENKIDYSDGANKVFDDFKKYTTKNVNDKTQVQQLIDEIRDLCSNNDYINKICITTSFTSLYQSDRLDSYLSQSNKDIYLDTPILVFALCKYYHRYFENDDLAKWNDIFFKATSGLIDACEQNSERINLHTTFDYIKEAAGELKKAINISYFLDFNFLKNLGEIKNSFINFYFFLKQNNYFEDTEINDFIDFIYDLGFDNFDPNNGDFMNDAISTIKDFVESWDIAIKFHNQYSDFEMITRDYHLQLMTQEKEKSKTATENDVKTIIWLASKEYSDNYTNNILSSWDTTLYDLRKTILKKYSDKYIFFHIYNPSRLLNKICLERFSTNPENISNDIFAYADANYNISSKVRSLIEMIAPIIGAKAKKSTRFIRELGDIRKKEIEETSIEDITKTRNLPLEDLLVDIIGHFKSPENQLTLDDFALLITDSDYAGKVLATIKDALESISKTHSSKKEITQKAITNLDELILSIKSVK
jgi:hypothetical protein